jgi:ATP-dependent Lhr-like helicase
VLGTPRASGAQREVLRSQRNAPSRSAPLALMLRRDAGWLRAAAAVGQTAEPPALGPLARRIHDHLAAHGASFLGDLVTAMDVPPDAVEDALWELVGAGLATADGFASLRVLVDRRRGELKSHFDRASTSTPPVRKWQEAIRRARTRDRGRPGHALRALPTAAGRWSLLPALHPPAPTAPLAAPSTAPLAARSTVPLAAPSTAPLAARSTVPPGSAAIAPPGGSAPSATIDAEASARQLLQRYGVVFRDLLARESSLPPWRDLLVALRRLEARGEIRGGRFVTGFVGEQFALPEALDELRACREPGPVADVCRIAATDPANLVGILSPGPRVPAVLGNAVLYLDGHAVASIEAGQLVRRAPLPPGAWLDDDLTYHPPPRPIAAPPQATLPL